MPPAWSATGGRPCRCGKPEHERSAHAQTHPVGHAAQFPAGGVVPRTPQQSGDRLPDEGAVPGAERRLDRARLWLDQDGPGGSPASFSVDRLRGFEGLCALHSGDAAWAHEQLSRSLSTLDAPRDAVQRGIVSSDLALARLRLGEPAACVELLHEAVDLVASTGGRVPARRLRQARRELRPWRAEGFVGELDDHVNEALIGR